MTWWNSNKRTQDSKKFRSQERGRSGGMMGQMIHSSMPGRRVSESQEVGTSNKKQLRIIRTTNGKRKGKTVKRKMKIRIRNHLM